MQSWSLNEKEQEGLGDSLDSKQEKSTDTAQDCYQEKKISSWERSFAALRRNMSGRCK